MPYNTPEKQRAYQERRKQRYREDPEMRARAQAANKRWREANPERSAEAIKRWAAANPDRRRASKRRYLENHPGKSRDAHLWRRHGMRQEEVAEMWEQQGGDCYLCQEPVELDEVHIDHDHRHCPQDYSCRACRRGLVHHTCNVSIGHAGDDPAKLRRWADNLEVAQRAATERIAAASEQLPLDMAGC